MNTISIIIIIICLLLSAYFSATETAFSTFNKFKMKSLQDKGSKKAKLVLKLSDNYDSLISTILIGNNIVNILSASLATMVFINIINSELGPSVSTVVMTIVVLIFGEISPKVLAKEHPEQFAMFSSRFINIFMIILTPINYLFKNWKKLLSVLFKSHKEDNYIEDELIQMVDFALEEGTLDEDESMIIKSAVQFNDLSIKDIFTPRIDVIALEVSSSKKKIFKSFIDFGFSRIPIYDTSIDNLIGILYYKDYLKYCYNKENNIKDILKPIIYVTKHQNINDVLKLFQEKQLHFAVVIDEYGSLEGIVTLEDILEELVGDIWDETDEIDSDLLQVTEEEWIASGKISINKLFMTLNILDKVEVYTLNGWIIDELKYLPPLDYEFKYKEYSFKIISLMGKRIDKVRIIKNNLIE